MSLYNLYSFSLCCLLDLFHCQKKYFELVQLPYIYRYLICIQIYKVFNKISTNLQECFFPELFGWNSSGYHIGLFLILFDSNVSLLFPFVQMSCPWVSEILKLSTVFQLICCLYLTEFVLGIGCTCFVRKCLEPKCPPGTSFPDQNEELFFVSSDSLWLKSVFLISDYPEVVSTLMEGMFS